MMKQKFYCCIGKLGRFDHTTLRYYRKESIKAFLEGSRLTWNECKRMGWKCVKVEVTIEAINQ